MHFEDVKSKDSRGNAKVAFLFKFESGRSEFAMAATCDLLATNCCMMLILDETNFKAGL